MLALPAPIFKPGDRVTWKASAVGQYMLRRRATEKIGRVLDVIYWCDHPPTVRIEFWGRISVARVDEIERLPS